MVEPGLPLRVKHYPNVWHRLKPPRARQISWAQNTLLFPLSPPGTFTLCGYICEGGGGRGGARNHGLRPRSLDKLAKPLRWFQLKLAVLPVGSINSELAQTLTSMGELFPLAPVSRSPLCLALSLPSVHPILCFPSTFYDRELHLGLSITAHEHYGASSHSFITLLISHLIHIRRRSSFFNWITLPMFCSIKKNYKIRRDFILKAQTGCFKTVLWLICEVHTKHPVPQAQVLAVSVDTQQRGSWEITWSEQGGTQWAEISKGSFYKVAVQIFATGW